MHGDVINHCVPAGSKKKEKEKEWNCNFSTMLKRVPTGARARVRKLRGIGICLRTHSPSVRPHVL